MLPFPLLWIVLIIFALGGGLFWLWSRKSNDDRENSWVTVYQVANASQLVFLKSVLENAKIPYAVVGERAQNLFGLGQMGTGYNVITGPVRLQVPASQAEEALQLLQEAE